MGKTAGAAGCNDPVTRNHDRQRVRRVGAAHGPRRSWPAEPGGDLAVVSRGERRERVNMLLVGPQPLGTWVLVALGFAKEVVSQDELVLIEEALAVLAASLDGDYDAREHFTDLEHGREHITTMPAGTGEAR